MERQIEILAPAGSYESMRAAMNAGCDAVYMGGSRFGARAYAENPTEDILLKAIDEVHLRNKRIYLTVNTLVKEEEMRSYLYDYLEKYYLAGLDAVIVQDVGVMNFIHTHFPKLPIHASTQTTITMAQGANILKSMGVTRLVTARELSFKEIKNIRDNTDMEIETFVHGALCYCYSGQCLMSSMIGGRSGNRGRCAQPCRMPYQFFSGSDKISSDNEPYLLSPKDINTISLIPELIDAGVDSFKIEGRMKRPEYAAGVTFLYRKYVDLYLREGREKFSKYLLGDEFNRDMLDLMDLYNRGGFSEGYGKTYHGKTMMSMVRPNHSGVKVGEIVSVEKGYAGIALSQDINAQDILEIRNNRNEPVYEFTMKDDRNKKENFKARVGTIPNRNLGKNKNGKKPVYSLKINIGDAVYRTRNNKLLSNLQDKFISKDEKLPIKGYLGAKSGERLQLSLEVNNHFITAYHNIVEPAIKQPMTKEKLQSSIDKLGDTMFYFKELDIEVDGNIFVPVSWLNEIRREAVDALTEEVTKSYRRTKKDLGTWALSDNNALHCKVDNGNTVNNNTDIKIIGNNIIENQITENETENQIAENQITENNTENHIIENQIIESKTENKITENNKYENDNSGFCNISVAVENKEQFKVALNYSEISAIYVDYDGFSPQQIIELSRISSNAGKGFYILLPHICRLVVYEKLKKNIVALIEEDTIEGFIIKNFEEIGLLQEVFVSTGIEKKVRINHNMYIFNEDAKVFWKDKGIYDFTAPIELNKKELGDLGLKDCEMMVYGYLPVMVSAQCLYASTKGCSKCKEGETRIDYMTDRIGKKFYVRTNCNSCYNIIYNGQRLSLLGHTDAIKDIGPYSVRLDFAYESSEEMNTVLKAFTGEFVYGRKAVLEYDNITTGHFKRGVE